MSGLTAGADDYLAKPFALVELLARVDALLRHSPSATMATVLRVEDLEMRLLERKVLRGSEVIDLQAREFELLEYLMRNADRVVTRTMLLESIWKFHFDPKTNIVATHISRLRAKVDHDRPVQPIHSIRKIGHILSVSRPTD